MTTENFGHRYTKGTVLFVYLMLLTLIMTFAGAQTAGAGEYTATYQARFTYLGGLYNIILVRSGNSSQSATIADKNSGWPKTTSVCVNDEYDVTFKPSQNLSIATNPGTTTAIGFTISSGTTITASVANNSSYYIKQVRLLNSGIQKATSATTAPNSRSATVTASGDIQFNYIEVTLTDDFYGTITPQNGLTVGTAASLTYNNTNYYKTGTTVTVAPTNQYHIVEGTGGTGSASATIAADKRSFSFTMPAQNISPTATLTEVHTVTPASGLQVTSDAHFTYSNTKYYKVGNTVTVAPTSQYQYHIVENPGGIGSSSATVAADKRSFSFTMPAEDVEPTATLTEVHTVTLPNGLSLSGDATYTIGTARYYTVGATATLTVDDADKIIMSLTATGAASSSIAADKRSASITIGTSDATVSATLQIGGVIDGGVTWSVSDTDDNGSYDRLTLSGSGTLSTSPWDAAYAASITRVDINSADITISGSPFSALGSDVTIVAPTPAYAVSYASTAFAPFAEKIRAKFGSYLFTVTTEGGSAAYAITSPDDLNNLAAAVNAGNDGSGKTFRQTINIEYSHKAENEEGADTENNYTAIGRSTLPFRGHYDGQGHTVSGIRIYKGNGNSNDNFHGLFSSADAGAVIQGITLADTRITGHIWIGGIAGVNDGTITDCHVAADVTIRALLSSSDSHGGIAGSNSGTVSDCTSAATLTAPGARYFGGIVGDNGGTLRHNFSIGAVVPATTENKYGAICGRNEGGTLENNYYYGCKVASNDVTATGVGCGKIDDGHGGYTTADITTNNGAVPAFLVTLNDGVTIQTAMAADLGYSYDGKNYWRTGAELTLVLPDLPTNVPTGYLRYAYAANGKEISGNTLTVGNEDITVKRTLIVDPAQAKWVTLNTDGDGTVAVDECTGVMDNGDGTYAVVTGTTISVKATPAAGSYFKGWNSEAAINSNVAVTSTFTVTDNMTLTAHFVAKPMLTLSADGNGTVDIQGFIYGEKSIIPSSSITVREVCTSYEGEKGDNLFDGIVSGNNKWCTLADSKYVEFRTPSAVTVNGYTLYTANDNSTSHGRNPKSWVLKARNSGENNWTTIDSVANDNTMKDVDYTPFDFLMDDPGSYRYFRFEVKEVHEGVTLQLGELQLFYQEFTPIEGVTEGATPKTYIVDYGTAITVKATPDEGKCVRNWDSDDPIIPATTATVEKIYTLTENTTATAHFASYHTLTPGADLTVNGVPVSQSSTISVPTGSTVVLSHHQEGYTAHYTVNTTAIDGNTFTMPDEDVTVTVTFTEKNVLALSDHADNASAIATAAASGKVYEVTLSGRRLYKDGGWNTLCLPFDVVIAGSPLAGAEVRGLDNANLTDGVLTLNFTAKGAVTTIEAGRPYIIRWDKAEGYDAADPATRDLVSPVFSYATMKSGLNDVIGDNVTFKGTYAHISWTEENKSILFMGDKNTLHWPLSGASLGACRAYFQLADGAEAREFKLNFGEETTGIISTTDFTDYTDKGLTPSPSPNGEGSNWYSLDGRKLDGKPTRKGLYIYGGKKVIVR